MIRVVLVGIVAFVVGLAGASVWAARSDGPSAGETAGADSTAVAADSTQEETGIALAPPLATDPAYGAGEADAGSLSDGMDRIDEQNAAAPEDPTGSAPGSTLSAPIATAVSDAGGEAGAPPLANSRLGKIFTAMQPREAARVLEQMSDHDVTVILGMVTDRQAAAILSNLAPERAAGISRDVLRSGRTGP
jgi:hypothetical protein